VPSVTGFKGKVHPPMSSLSMGNRILLMDDPHTGADLLHMVQGLGHDAVLAASASEAATRLRNQRFALCLADVRLAPEQIEALLEAAHAARPPVPVVAITAGPSVKEAVAALRAGAVDFLCRPFSLELCADTIRRVLAAPSDGASAVVVGEHPAVRLMVERIDHVAGTDANILIRGEAGTGKEMIARLLHAASTRSDGPFVAVSAAELPDALAETALFGDAERAGLLAQAAGGTLFLDEVHDLPVAAQQRLLRSLEERGPARVRIISASTRNFEQLLREGAFSDDLYYRLDVIPIEVPALRERVEDIAILADHFRRDTNARAALTVPGFSAEVLKRLCSYPWPGNLRQLQATVDRVVRQAGDRQVDLEDLPTTLRPDVVELGVGTLDLPPSGVDLRLLLTRLEDRLIGQALQRTGGNKNRAAELLGMNRTTLVEKLRRRNVA
jgi:DNA-binding NtrC family response regulator